MVSTVPVPGAINKYMKNRRGKKNQAGIHSGNPELQEENHISYLPNANAFNLGIAVALAGARWANAYACSKVILYYRVNIVRRKGWGLQ